MINLLICKLYDNFIFGNNRPSIFHFFLAQISISFIILHWLYVLIYFLNIALIKRFGFSLTWLYILLFFIIFYILNKKTWTINGVEEFINDRENERILNRTIWVFWASLIIPTIIYTLIFKS